MMLAAWLIGAAATSLVGSPDPTALVHRLGAPRFADREGASTELEKLGRQALPALRQAAGSGDPEIRDRAASLIGRIERQRLVRPTSVALDLKDVPLETALDALEARSGLALRVDPSADPAWKARKVTLQANEPIPFWQALDRICQAGGIRQSTPLNPPSDRGERAIRLVPGDPETYPTSYSGPFRIRLLGLRKQQRGAAGLLARIEVAAEPGLNISPTSPLKILGAVDEKGQAMLPPRATEGTNPSGGRRPADDASPLTWEVLLTLPDVPGKRIERLRGEVSVSIGARQPDPQAFPLNTAEGKAFRVGDATVRVDRVIQQPGLRLDRDAFVQVNLQISRESAAADQFPPRAFRNGRPPALPISAATERTLRQIEFLDPKGNRCEKTVAQTNIDFAGGERLILVVRPAPGAGGGTAGEIVVHDLIRARTDVPFEFKKVLMP